MSNKTDRQILTELLNSLMDEEIVFVRERLMAIVDYSLHDEKLIRDGMVNTGVSADLYINTLKRIKTIIKYDTEMNNLVPAQTTQPDPSGFEEVKIEVPENISTESRTKFKKRASNKK